MEMIPTCSLPTKVLFNMAGLLVFVTTAAGVAQTTEQLNFEAASVKRTDQCRMQNSVDPGTIALNGDPLKVVLMEAFHVKMDQIIGPSWLDTDCFVITAKMPEGATRDQLPAMLQALLVERFKLAAHKESRLRAGFGLVVDKNGPKFKESDASVVAARAGPVTFGFGAHGRIKGAMTMALLAQRLSNSVGGPVQDLTGLKGTYDIDFSWMADQSGSFAQASAAANASSADVGASVPAGATTDIFTSVRESLGLKLEPRKLPIEVVVVDHIERVPTTN